jgi:hypothetical protein
MRTAYDLWTVALFIILVGYFFLFTDRRPQRLKHFLLVAVALAIANQIGNAGKDTLAIILIVAGIAYAGLMSRG